MQAQDSTSQPEQSENAVETQQEPTQQRREKDRNSNLFGFHGTLAIPHPVSFGLDYHLNSSYSFSISTGSYSGEFDKAQLGISNTEVSARWHVFDSSFFMGVHAGQQKLKAERTQLVQGENVTVKAEIDSMYYTPHIGWMYVRGAGLTVATEFGYMMSPNAKVDVSSNASPAAQANGEHAELLNNTQRAIKEVSNGFFHFVILRIGFVF